MNLGLAVTGKRPDGYHDLRSVMIKLRLADTIKVSWPNHTDHEGGRGAGADSCIKEFAIYLTTNDPRLPSDHRNLAHKAAMAYVRALTHAGLAHLLPEAISLHIEKHVPYGAGLGGGSSDAASTIRVMHSMAGEGARAAHPTREPRWLDDIVNIADVALSVGSDIPFFLGGSASLVEGRGERLRPIFLAQRLYVLCAMPHGALSTKAVYDQYDIVGSDVHPDIDTVAEALESNHLHLLHGAVYNSLEKSAKTLLPEVGCIRQLIEPFYPLCCSMTGSGACVYGVFTERADAERALHTITSDQRVAWATVTETLCEEQ